MRYYLQINSRASQKNSEVDLNDSYQYVFDMSKTDFEDQRYVHTYKSSWGMYRSTTKLISNHTELYSCVFWDW